MKACTCSDLVRSLSVFIDGELEPSQALAFQQHVEACKACAARVSFARASRTSIHNTVKSVKAPEGFRSHVTGVVAEASAAQDRNVMAGPRLLSWRVTGPLAAAAALALVWASVAKLQDRAVEPSSPKGAAQTLASGTAEPARASMIAVDALVDSLVDQHANPLPPETTNPTEMARFDRFIGVPVRDVPRQGLTGQGQLLGARMVPLHEQRAAMFQYVMGNGRRVSLYVYNPKKVRLGSCPKLRQRVIKNETSPVYVGYVRGYSVAVTDRRGVGYAMASDLDEQESSKLILAVGNQ